MDTSPLEDARAASINKSDGQSDSCTSARPNLAEAIAREAACRRCGTAAGPRAAPGGRTHKWPRPCWTSDSIAAGIDAGKCWPACATAYTSDLSRHGQGRSRSYP